MEMALNLSLYRHREPVARSGAVVIGVCALLLSQVFAMRHEPPVLDDSISLSIADSDAPQQAVQQVIQTPPPPKPVVEPPKEVVPVTDAPAPAIQETVQQPQPVQQVQPKGNPDAEKMYAQGVRARIERKKVYPDAARDMGMTGTVEVRYEVDRSGKLLRAEILTSSGFKMLDQAALKSVKDAAPYPVFPDEGWQGASSMWFSTKIDFQSY